MNGIEVIGIIVPVLLGQGAGWAALWYKMGKMEQQLKNHICETKAMNTKLLTGK